MKALLISLCAALSLGFAGQNQLPSVEVTTPEGKTVNTSTFSNDGKPMVISFWATWCKPCLRELGAIDEVYEDWQEELGVKLIAVSIDDSRNMAKVGPMALTNGWEYEVYIDLNQDFKRALGVNNIPHTFVVDGKGKIVWQHTSYALGDEDELYEVLEKVATGQSIDAH